MRRYGVALLATSAAFGASLLLWPVIDPNAFALLCAAVMVSAWYGGLGPGLLATGLATYAGAYLLARSLHSPQFWVDDAVRLGLFMGAALLISTLNARRKRAEHERELILEHVEAERVHDVTERKRIELERDALLAREQAARAAAEAAACRAVFLAEAGSVLAASLDYETTLASVARLAVPFLADWCTVDLLEPNGALRRIAVAHADPADAELARAGATCPPDPDGTHPRTRVVRSARSELFPALTDEVLASAAASREHLAALRRLGCRSAMIVPLVARGQTLGAMTFVTAASGRSCDREDLAVAEALAYRAALAADNARLYREAREANRVKDEFLMTLSHELRTPLSAAVVWAGLLEKGKVDPTKVPRASEAIARNIASLARMVEDLTDVSRIVAGKLRLRPGPVDLKEVIAAAIVTVRPAAQAKGVRLEWVPVGALQPAHRVWGDAGRLQQVVWNLLANAIKFTPEGGRVEVCLEQTDSQAGIVVRDSGQGIRPDFLPFVFDRFRQGDGATTRTHGGLGLGLAIVRQLVELHGGTVRAESPGEGQGAVFTVSLPIRASRLHSGEDSEGQGPTEPPSLWGLRVLVVDDEADARECLTAVLEQCGAVVTAVASAREALGALAWRRPDILVSDIGMPGEDGYSLIRKIRRLDDRHGGRIPAVAVTAYAGQDDCRKVLAAGYQLHVTKPVTPEQLVAAVASLSGRSAA